MSKFALTVFLYILAVLSFLLVIASASLFGLSALGELALGLLFFAVAFIIERIP